MKLLLLFYITFLSYFCVLGRKSCSCIINENTQNCCDIVNGKNIDNGNCLINISVTPFFDCCRNKSENGKDGYCKNIH